MAILRTLSLGPLIHITQIERLLLDQLLDPMLSSHLILDYRCGIAASSCVDVYYEDKATEQLAS